MYSVEPTGKTSHLNYWIVYINMALLMVNLKNVKKKGRTKTQDGNFIMIINERPSQIL